MTFKRPNEIIVPVIAGKSPYIGETDTLGTIEHARDFAWFDYADAVQFLKITKDYDPETDRETLEIEDITADMAEARMADYAKDCPIDDWSKDHLPLYVKNADLFDDRLEAEIEASWGPTDLEEHGTYRAQNGRVVG